MKTFRLLAVALFLSALGSVASAQESSEFSALRAKAEKGNGIAQYNLGLAYAEGHGVAADRIEAFVWLSLARENGARGRALDNLAASLDKATFDAAQQRLAERKGTAVVKAPPAPVIRAAIVPKPAPVETPVVANPAAPAVDPATLTGPAAVAAERRQLSSEVAQALKEIEGLKAELAEAKSQTAPDIMRLRQERDILSAKFTELTTAAAALRTDRDRLQTVAAQAEKDARNAGEAGHAAQESARASEARIRELVRDAEAATAELARTKQSLTALVQAPKPAPDAAALEQKTHELQAVTAELETARNFGHQIEATLNKVNDQQAALETSLSRANEQKTALEQKLAAAQSAASDSGSQADALKTATAQLTSIQAELARVKADLADQSRKSGSQVESLNAQLADLQQKLAAAPSHARTSDQQAAQLKARDKELAQLRTSHDELASHLQQLTEEKSSLEKKLAAKDTNAARVRELESALAAKPAAPAYPDLSGRVAELGSQLAALRDSSGNSAKTIDALKAQLQAAQNDVQLLGQKVKQADMAMSQTQESYGALQDEAKKLRERPVAPVYPDLSGKVGELEAQLAALASAKTEANRAKQEVTALTSAKEDAVKELADTKTQLASARSAAPAYPDLSGRVKELEATLAAKPAAPAYPDLNGRVKELEGQAAADATALAATKTNADKVGQELIALTKAKEDAQAQIDTLTAERNTARNAQNELGSALTKLEQEKNRLATAQNPSAETSRQLVALGEKTAAAEKQSATLRQERDTLSAKMTDLAGNLATLQADRERMQKLLADTGKKLKDSTEGTSRVKELEARATGLQSSLAAAEVQAHGLTSERDAARAAQNELRDAVAKLEQEHKRLAAAQNTAPAYPDLSGRVSELEAALATATAHVSELAVTAAEHAKLATDLQAELKQAQATLAAKPSVPAYPDLSGKVQELESAGADSARQLAEATTALQNATRTKGNDDTQLRRERDELSARVTALASETAQLRDDSVRMQKLLADADKKLRNSADNASRVQELEARAAGLQSSLAAAETQANGLTSERNAARTAQNELRDNLAKLEQEKKQLAAAQNAAPTYPDLSNRVRELEAQVAAANQQADTVAQGAVAASKQSTADLIAATEQIARLKTALAEKPSAPAYPDLSGKVQELESAGADSARQLAAAGTAQSELQRQLAEATMTLQTATKTKGSDDSQLRRERDELSTRVTALAGEIAQLRADRERMQKLLADSGKQLRDSTADASRIKELETHVSSDQSAVASAKAEASQARDQITALTKAKEEADTQIITLQNSLATKNAAPAYPDLSGKVSELESQLNNLQTALAAKPAAPAYPDLSGRVSELEAQLAALTKAKEDTSKRGSTYPNFAGRVVELENALADTKRQLADAQTALHAAEQTKPAPAAAPEANPSDLQKQLAETEDKLATALRGYALLERERDAQAAKASQANEAVAAERNSLSMQVATLTTEAQQLKAAAQSNTGNSQAEISRLNESLTALQHSTAQNAGDLATTRALLLQLQGANAVLAGENYQLKTMLARSTGAPGPVKVAPVAAPPGTPAARTHVVASGDSLSRISQRYYGTANRWQEIYNANRDKIGADGLLRIGTELRVP